jgi:hypothetical protein
MTFRIITRGTPRQIASEFRCPTHGVFTAIVDSGTDAAPCPVVVCNCDACRGAAVTMQDIALPGLTVHVQRCGLASPWTPSLISFRMRRVEATRGNHERAQHKGWLDTSNLEEGQSFDDWQADREAVHEELRKDLVMQMVKEDR